MIKLKYLISESEGNGITARDIYNFYFLELAKAYNPQAFQTDYGKFIEEEYLGKLKLKYITLFKNLLFQQLKKYAERGRIDPTFPKDKLTHDGSALDASEIESLMRQTFRSDMTRRNDVWILAAEFVKQLEAARTPQQIYVMIDRLNNAVHNTQTSILGKVSYDLVKAMDKAFNAKSIHELSGLVDPDLRRLLSQDVQEGKEEPDFYGTANKRITADTAHGKSETSMFRKSEKDDEKEKDKEKKPFEFPLQEGEDMDFYGTADKRIEPGTPIGKNPSVPQFAGPGDKEDTKDAPKDLPHPLEEGDTVRIRKVDQYNPDFMNGLKAAIQDKKNGIQRPLDDKSEDFVRGYKTLPVNNPSWWDRWNDKLTNWLARLGNSKAGRISRF